MGVKFEKVSKEIQIYPEAFKRKVVEEYLSGTCSKMDLLRKYGIKTKSGIQRWMKSLNAFVGVSMSLWIAAPTTELKIGSNKKALPNHCPERTSE